MEIEQATELTYSMVNDIDKKVNEILDMVTDSKPESSTSLKDLTNEIKDDTDTIISKLDLVLENEPGGTTVDFGNIEEKIDNLQTNLTTLSENITSIDTDVSNINLNISDLSSDITTTNSNVATIKQNVSSIQSNINTIQENLPKKAFDNEITQKLDEILKSVKTIQGIDTFEEDPFKLSLPYSGKIETNRNPSNYDFYEITKEFTTKNHFFNILAHSTGTTFSYNFEMTFTNTGSRNLKFLTNFNSETINYAAGTHTITRSGTDINIVNNRIIFNFSTTSNITIHHIKIELFGENILILPKQTKYKVTNARDKVIITKVENNNGYYLILNNKQALTPDLIKQEFTLDVENIKDYALCYDFGKYLNNEISLAPIKGYVDLSNKFTSNYSNGYNFQLDSTVPVLTCNFGFFNKTAAHWGTTIFTSELDPRNCCFTTIGEFMKTTYSIERGYPSESVIINDLSTFDTTIQRALLFSSLQGKVYFGFASSNYIEIGHGKNLTGYFNPDNPLQVTIYFNDGGYCVKSIVEFKEDKTDLKLLSQTIIGTYDAYFETNSEVYLVEKDKQLYMFKK
ncbi:MAG: hypothetical protein E7359_04560 [Clostridiales bacterium]|nr:hypothetical protein [Clostridiales bacterium]